MDDQQQKTQTHDGDKSHDQGETRAQDRPGNRQRSGEPNQRTVAPQSDAEQSHDGSGSMVDPGSMVDAVNQAATMMRDVGEQAWSAAANAGAAATDLARQARDQVSGALSGPTERADEYISRNVNAYPLAALMIAGAVGYGMAYLFHSNWQTQDQRGDNRDSQTRQTRQTRDDGEDEHRSRKH